MSDRWQCAVCEGVNDGGEVCTTCGAPRSRTTELAAAAERPEREDPIERPAPQRQPAGEEGSRTDPRRNQPEDERPADDWLLAGPDQSLPGDDGYAVEYAD